MKSEKTQNLVMLIICIIIFFLLSLAIYRPFHHEKLQHNCIEYKLDCISANAKESKFYETLAHDPTAHYTQLLFFATSGLAVFTLLLAFATIALIFITQNGIDSQAKMIRAEYLATHRPRMKIHEVWINIFDSEKEDQFYTLEFMLINAGESKAFIKSINVYLYYQKSREPFAPGDELGMPRYYKEPIQIGPGEQKIIKMCVRKDVMERYLFEDAVAETVADKGRLFYVGRINYCGGDGISRISGFCREDKEGGIQISDHPHYEYSY